MLDSAMKIKDQLVSWWRDFHMHTGLGFEEKRTANAVAEAPKEMGIRVDYEHLFDLKSFSIATHILLDCLKAESPFQECKLVPTAWKPWVSRLFRVTLPSISYKEEFDGKGVFSLIPSILTPFLIWKGWG